MSIIYNNTPCYNYHIDLRALHRQNRPDCQLYWQTFLYSCFAASRSYAQKYFTIWRLPQTCRLCTFSTHAQASVPKVWSSISGTSQSLYKQFNARESSLNNCILQCDISSSCTHCTCRNYHRYYYYCHHHHRCCLITSAVHSFTFVFYSLCVLQCCCYIIILLCIVCARRSCGYNSLKNNLRNAFFFQLFSYLQLEVLFILSYYYSHEKYFH